MPRSALLLALYARVPSAHLLNSAEFPGAYPVHLPCPPALLPWLPSDPAHPKLSCTEMMSLCDEMPIYLPAGEGNMLIFQNQLLAGIVDKAAFGKHGLLHIYHVSGLSAACW